jgi:CBS domain-containing protein
MVEYGEAVFRRRAMQMRSLRSIVAGRPPVTVSRDATVVDAARQMKQRATSARCSCSTPDRLAGIFTERDALFRVLAAGRDPATTTIGDVMTPQPQTMHPDEPFVRALRVMHEGKFRHLPVVEFGRPLGIVSVRDALDDDLVELPLGPRAARGSARVAASGRVHPRRRGAGQQRVHLDGQRARVAALACT